MTAVAFVATVVLAGCGRSGGSASVTTAAASTKPATVRAFEAYADGEIVHGLIVTVVDDHYVPYGPPSPRRCVFRDADRAFQCRLNLNVDRLIAINAANDAMGKYRSAIPSVCRSDFPAIQQSLGALVDIVHREWLKSVDAELDYVYGRERLWTALERFAACLDSAPGSGS
jgi:hypothetical protein